MSKEISSADGSRGNAAEASTAGKLPGAKAVIVFGAIAAVAATLSLIEGTSAFHSPTARRSHVTSGDAASWHAQDGKLLWLPEPKDGLRMAAAAPAPQPAAVSEHWHAQNGRLLWLPEPAGEQGKEGLRTAAAAPAPQPAAVTEHWHAQNGKLLWLPEPAAEPAKAEMRTAAAAPAETEHWHAQDGKLLWLPEPAGEQAKDGLKRR